MTDLVNRTSDGPPEQIMNTYDPAHFIAYVRMDRRSAALRTSTIAVEHPLPVGYANQSPRTTLRSRTAQGTRSAAVSPSRAAQQR